MRTRAKLVLALLSISVLAACSSSSNSPRAVPAPAARNEDGSVVTGVITARFDPSTGVVPFPNNLLLSGTRDLTLNIPVANPNNFADPQVALNALDGFSTVSPWSFSMSTAPRANSLIAGQSIRVFEVALTGVGGAVTRIVRELASPSEFIVAQSTTDTSGRTVGVVPTSPLKSLTSYLVVVTSGVKDASGNDATPDSAYFLAKRTTPLCTAGASTDPLLPNSTACGLEPLRQLTNAAENAFATTTGVSRDKVVLSWVATTQSNSVVLRTVQGLTQPSTARIAATGLTTAAAGLPAVADIYIGTLALPYYLAAPTAQNPAAILSTFWKASPGNYQGAFAQAGLDTTSTNLTFANPIPARQSTENVPLLVTVPNATSGRTRPAAGWPVVIYTHGITRNRTDMLAVAATYAAQGFAVVAIDQPLHGVTDAASPFNIANTPFAAGGARERTFSVDLVNNTTGAAGPDGQVDSSGTHFINLASLLTSRDNLRQSVADLITLAKTIPQISLEGTGTLFDGSRIGFTGQSLGSIVGSVFLAVEPSVTVGVLNVPGGGIARLLDGSATFGPRIRAGLAAGGLQAGTPSYDSFMGAAQTVIDAADPINYGPLTVNKRILAQLVVGNGSNNLSDQVVPVSVTGAPLSGGEPLVRVLGLASITSSQQSTTGIRGVVRFTAGDHGSLLSPAASAAVTAEMQGEMASMLVSAGTAVQVQNASVIRSQ
jgi:dienelactone hydrolase